MALQVYDPMSSVLGHRRSPLSRTLSLHDHILQAYLPYFASNHFQTNNDVDLILDAWLQSNTGLLNQSQYFPFRERDFRKALYHVLDTIEYTENYGGSIAEVSRRLLTELEEDWEDDLRSGSSRCQRQFRALAEVSTAALSWAVGSVLRTFFLGWIYELAQEEDTVSLAAWCWGVMRSYMDPREKDECLRAIVALRPDVIDELNESGANWVPVQQLNIPVVSWPRRRRDAGRHWWDKENDRRIRRLLQDQDDRDREKLVRLHLRAPPPIRRPRSRSPPIRRLRLVRTPSPPTPPPVLGRRSSTSPLRRLRLRRSSSSDLTPFERRLGRKLDRSLADRSLKALLPARDT